ncbi:unnamed protein product [Caenorhabditis auriculariae]|uniref:Uncharacterized protein n=1 Tax=Caenorhabditis auriculariae TaxID=2777116 RepID=A0A8S1H8W4_9PELO|nr:unnamed protein product [Caenorhabditis auriculariae]
MRIEDLAKASQMGMEPPVKKKGYDDVVLSDISEDSEKRPQKSRDGKEARKKRSMGKDKTRSGTPREPKKMSQEPSPPHSFDARPPSDPKEFKEVKMELKRPIADRKVTKQIERLLPSENNGIKPEKHENGGHALGPPTQHTHMEKGRHSSEKDKRFFTESSPQGLQNRETRAKKKKGCCTIL